MRKKSIFVGYKEDEVRDMEENYYCLQMAGDFILDDNQFLFTRAEISKIYKNVINDLIDIIHDGNEKDSKHAKYVIGRVFIVPMRLH
jgi:hypothetical protein